MRVYISGPITKDPGYMKKFSDAEKHLQDQGHEVLNPARVINALIRSIGWDLTYESILAMDLAMLQSCDAIYLLKGYENSNGARTERMMAARLGLEMIYQEELP